MSGREKRNFYYKLREFLDKHHKAMKDNRFLVFIQKTLHTILHDILFLPYKRMKQLIILVFIKMYMCANFLHFSPRISFTFSAYLSIFKSNNL